MIALSGAAVLAAGAGAASAEPVASRSTTPPAAERIAATTATYKAITDKIAVGRSLTNFDFTNFTSQLDVVDYGVDKLWSKGVDGAGTTVAFIVTNPDPHLADTLASFSAAMHLPPAQLTQLTLPSATNPSFVCKVECDTGEDELDAESIHMMAPYAKLLFVSPPVPETIGMQGWPQVAQAIKMIADRHLADVISVSLGDHETPFVNDPTNPGADAAAAIHSLDAGFLDAASKNIPVLFASGDCGVTGPPVLNDTGQCTPTQGLSADHPSDNPWVTSVGGTIPNRGLATPDGRTAADGLWVTGGDSEGAGVSKYYPQPAWQKDIPALKGITGRAYPDITADSDNGTSQASPTMAGILALATQLRGKPLGMINEALAKIGPKGGAKGLVDVLAGFSNSSSGFASPYKTSTGYDIPSGWGNVWAPVFVPALVKQLAAQDGAGNTPADQASTLLHKLNADASITVNRGTQVTFTGRGFIPGSTPNGTKLVDGYGIFPPLPGQYGASPGDGTADPHSTVPGQPWDTVKYTVTGGAKVPASAVKLSSPDGKGKVVIKINAANLTPGTYTLTVTGLLVTQRASFVISPFRQTSTGHIAVH